MSQGLPGLFPRAGVVSGLIPSNCFSGQLGRGSFGLATSSTSQLPIHLGAQKTPSPAVLGEGFPEKLGN